MDMKTFIHIRSLLKIIREAKEIKEKTKRQKQALAAFNRMSKALADGNKGTRIRRYFALFWLEDWWYLVFRTYKRRGAYLFLRLLNDRPDLLTKKIDGKHLWELISDHKRWVQAAKDSDSEEAEPQDCTDEETNEIENEDTPHIHDDGW